jgi:hypothetical protein
MQKSNFHHRPRGVTQLNSTSYTALEPRHLLTGLLQVDVFIPPGVSLIQNGQFSPKHKASGNHYFAHEAVGWNVNQPATISKSQQLRLTPYRGMGYVLDLGSTAGTSFEVYQDIPTTPGTRYLLSFDVFAPPSFDVSKDIDRQPLTFQVFWNGALIANISPGDAWKTVTFEVIGGNSKLSRLSFVTSAHEWPSNSTNIGGMIDNVRLIAASARPINNNGIKNLGLAFEAADNPGLGSRVPPHAMENRPGLRMSPMETTEAGGKSVEVESNVLHLKADNDLRDDVFKNLDKFAPPSYNKLLKKHFSNDQFSNMKKADPMDLICEDQ